MRCPADAGKGGAEIVVAHILSENTVGQRQHVYIPVYKIRYKSTIGRSTKRISPRDPLHTMKFLTLFAMLVVGVVTVQAAPTLCS